MAAKRVVVAGGNGFLGSRICKSAVARGWSVTSLSRSGEPRWDAVTDSVSRPSWASSVEWAKADILKPETYKAFLNGATAVVHSMGILLEADYKGVVQGREPILSGLQRAFSASRPGSQDLRGRREGEPLEVRDRSGQFTYELMNRDSAIALAQETHHERVPTFVYISAASGAPVLPSRYITTKREAESIIAAQLPELRNVFVQAPFMYDESRKFTLPIALGGFVGSQVNALLGNKLDFLGSMVTKPLKVDDVGEAVAEALEDESVRGALGVQKIEALATKAWRKSML
ncbi:mitochondrion protein [Aspergillus japonicus CBS 114.51]|uniref:Mitochondrion protein n=3 Tax=Aspergillus TaxID=5052 RepID=A0A2V5GWB2_ASPV1|nr:mitochondrion protein [Aspergillus japonicus CBS 114.51]PYI15401.1 mitochondrion protein [Aspergillus violaceofuscus CBS 115571]PYI26661.1 mitochondrion protein [Aspergillus indologenus CBS 114.80]RAH85610.1 mitochondrion protein [Aspergillus japonicus CBS 114.51]